MKSIIIYYSYSGNTKKVAEIFGEYLKQKSQVDLLELTSIDEPTSFFGQCRRAFRHQLAKISPVNFDLFSYDLVCFGTPVWAFGPAPAINTYLDKCTNIKNKEVILFSTYGSGTGNKRCLNYMQKILSAKGAGQITNFSIQQIKIKNKEFVLTEIKKCYAPVA